MKAIKGNKGMKLAGWSQSVQKKAGVKHVPESYRDVLMACDKYLRDRGLIKSIGQMKDEMFERGAR